MTFSCLLTSLLIGQTPLLSPPSVPAGSAPASRTPAFTITPTDGPPRLSPVAGERGSVVTITGRGVKAATRVLFGETVAERATPASGSAAASPGLAGVEQIQVVVPTVPTTKQRVTLQLPSGPVVAQPDFQVFQVPEPVKRTELDPCPTPTGAIGATITGFSPNPVQRGATLTVHVSGVLQTHETQQWLGDVYPLQIGVAFPYEPTPVAARKVAIVRDDRQQTASIATITPDRPDRFTIRIPEVGVTGQVALVTFRDAAVVGLTIQECRKSGPVLEVR